MRYRYSTTDPAQNEFDALPWLALRLRSAEQSPDVIGLVDSGATANVLPFDLGIQLGAVWDDARAIIRLAGTPGNQPAMPVFVTAEIADFPPVRLAFAWVRSTSTPLILGQTNFFLEFDVCFYRSRLAFEVNPKTPHQGGA